MTRPRVPALVERWPAACGAGLLLLAYLATLAPSVTLWDAGEFLSAIRTLGIPHPPGTPLFVFLAHAWTSVLGFVDFTVAANALSAVMSAVGVACLARTFAVGSAGAGGVLLASLVAGTGAALWQSATETEVYGYALCLAAVGLALADHAGAHWSGKHRRLVAFTFGLAVPLHISALVAGPAIMVLAATDAGGSTSMRAALPLAAAWCVATGIGTASVLPIAAGAGLALVPLLLPVGGAEDGRWEGIVAALLALLAASFTLVMLVRARHDPWVNQGNPVDWSSFLHVVARSQYDVPPIWPRRAPAWLQVGNLVQYADWQWAWGLDDWPGGSIRRTPVTLLFTALAVTGARWQRQRDARAFRAHLLLFLGASLGVVGILNLRAGPSYGIGVLAEGALHEARERDYFFAMAFAAWGTWVALGLVALARRLRAPALLTAVLAIGAVPVLANAPAMNRRREPDASLARALGVATLEAAPPGAVLLLAGDNDTYGSWWARIVEGRRADVTTVTLPLLPADWYREELRRRHGIAPDSVVDRWLGAARTVGAIVERAQALGRPVVAAAGVDRAMRQAVAPGWRFVGMAWVLDPALQGRETDPEAVARAQAVVRSELPQDRDRVARDGTSRYVQRLLSCPWQAGERGDRALLETTCNY